MSAQPLLRPSARPASTLQAPARLHLARQLSQPRYRRRTTRPATVVRSRLVRALIDDARSVAVLVAPAGYGKSTLLEQWSAQEPRPFAWVDLTAAHDEPRRLSAMLARTVGDIAATPTVLVLDDLQVLRSPGARAVVAALPAQLPVGSTLAVASREEPALPLGRLRAQDELVEVRARALAFTHAEATEVLRAAGPALGADATARLLEMTAGWPAALRLAIRALREQQRDGVAAAAFAGDDRIVVEYVQDEILAGLDGEDRDFLVRTSVLDALSGPACDALLGRRDSAARLRALSRANVLLEPLDRVDSAFRHHPLLAQALRRELACTDRALATEAHRRASDWYQGEGDLDRAVDHAVAGADSDRVSALLAERAPALVAQGRAARLDGWLDRLGDAEVAARPPLALAAALCRVADGDRDAAERWVRAAVQAAGTAPAGAGVIDAAVARDGVEAMVRDAARASAPGPWQPFADLLEGSAHALAGRTDEARARLDRGARGAVFDAPLVRSLCLAQLAFMALDEGDPEEAAALAGLARTALDRGEDAACPLAALTFAVCALVLASRGHLDAARQDIGAASARLATLLDVAPWYGALTRVALARAELRLSDAARARRLLSEASRLSRRMGEATALQAWIDEGWAQADDYAAGPVACPSVLTRAELRVLRLLPSHLSFREIAARLHVSANTVKTQAHAVYRKLDASSRSEAVAHARAMGLVDG